MQFQFEEDNQNDLLYGKDSPLQKLKTRIRQNLSYQQAVNRQLKREISKLEQARKQNENKAANIEEKPIPKQQQIKQERKERKSVKQSRRMKDLIMEKGFPSNPKGKQCSIKGNSNKLPYRFTRK